MNKRGILHKLMLLVILGLGFGLALTLPAFKRHQDHVHARQALQVVKQISQAERDFYARNGFYTTDFTQLVNVKHCHETVENGESILACAGYKVGLKGAHILRASNIKYPQWFEVDLDGGEPVCGYEEEAIVGQRLCAVSHL